MAKKTEIVKTPVVALEPTQVQQMIHVIRGQRVILDRDLAQLYGVETKVLNKQVQRNIERFPGDFMFQLTNQEFTNLRFQNGTSSWGGTRYMPHAFTEEGVAMLSGLLHSPVAIQVNIQIMRAFVYMKNTLSAINETATRQDHLELEVEKSRNYVEDILRDQNDTNELVGAQMEAINESLVELAVKVDSLTQKKREPMNAIGFAAAEARYEEEAKKRAEKANTK
jgi:hypothetical protein